MKLLIYTLEKSKRLHYAASTLLGEVEITTNESQFAEYGGPKIFYALRKENEPLSVHFSGWLYDGKMDNVFPLAIEQIENKHIVSSAEHVEFDVFAFTFFLLSRYEEYQTFKADYVGRFDVTNSVAAPASPVVDRWRVQLLALVKKHFPDYQYELPVYTASLTVDVDSAYAFRYKGLKRTLGGQAKDLVRRDLRNFFARNQTLLFGKKDPFDTYEAIEQLAQLHQLPLTYFFLLGDFNPYDINLPHTSRGLRSLIEKSSNKAQIGIHPGVGSHKSLAQLEIEIARLKSILGSTVTLSRQHYLKLHFPESYRRLIKCSIQHDYTMGYSGDTRFRAGTSLPFAWYDLEKDEVTSLVVHPFAAMDATLKNYLRFSKRESLDRIKELRRTIEENHGHFCLLWHNESVSDFGQWRDWSSIFPEVLSIISANR